MLKAATFSLDFYCDSETIQSPLIHCGPTYSTTLNIISYYDQRLISACYGLPPISSDSRTCLALLVESTNIYSTSGSRRGGARRSGEAERSRAGRDTDRSVRPECNLPFLLSRISRASKRIFCTYLRKHKETNFLCKPIKEQHSRLTRGLFAIYSRLRPLFALGC